MSHAVEAVAVAIMLAGFALFTVLEAGLVGALLVAGGSYAMILPQFLRQRKRAPGR